MKYDSETKEIDLTEKFIDKLDKFTLYFVDIFERYGG